MPGFTLSHADIQLTRLDGLILRVNAAVYRPQGESATPPTSKTAPAALQIMALVFLLIMVASPSVGPALRVKQTEASACYGATVTNNTLAFWAIRPFDAKL